MAARPDTLLDAWHSWNTHHRQIPKDIPQYFANKTAINKFHRQIRASWKSLSVEHPIDHGQRKLRFHNTAKRFRFVNRQYLRATERLAAEINRGVLGEPETHEHVLHTQIVKLQALKAIVRIEDVVLGPPADVVRVYDNRRITAVKNEFQTTAGQAARARRQHELNIDNEDPPLEGKARERYGLRYQQNFHGRNVDRHAGGSMYFQRLYSSDVTMAGVWILTNANNIVVDRVAVKDTYLHRYFNQLWTTQANWFGDTLDPTTKQPWEVRIHQKLLDPSILRPRGWHMHADKLMYRMCLEYCPYGDAAELFDRYERQYKRAAPGANIAHHMLPEPAIWCAFEALIKAGLVMEHGSVGLGVQPPAQWDGASVAHLDMKPDNLFIGEYPNQNVGGNWAMYPSFKVADFGHSCDDNRLPQAFVHYRGRGTLSYQAPEQMDAHNYHGQRPIDPLDTKTNVWGVGITIMAMMNMWSEAGAKNFREAAQNENHPNLIPSFTAGAQNKFSGELKRMILDCLQFRHVNRPTFRALLNRLNLHTGLGGPQMSDRAEGARFATRANPAPNAPLLHDMLANDYLIGFTMPPSNTIQPS